MKLNLLYPAFSRLQTLRLLLLMVALLSISSSSFAQWSGPTSALTGVQYTYSYNDGSTYGIPRWTVSNGTVISSSYDGITTYSAVVQWTASGTLNFQNKVTIISSLAVSACASPNVYSLSYAPYCVGGTTSLVTSGSQVGVTYTLYRGVNPNAGGSVVVGTIAGTGGSLSFPNISGGNHWLDASGSGICTTTIASLTVNSSAQPNYYAVQSNGAAGGSYCGSVNISLTGSQTGVNYQLTLNGGALGGVVAGTNGALSWPGQTNSGTYGVVATLVATGCAITMSGIGVTVNPLPNAYAVTGGGQYCPGFPKTVTLANSQTGVNYQLMNGGSPIGIAVGGTGGQLNWTGLTSLGNYWITGTNTTTSCAQNMGNSVDITAGPVPTVAITTGPTICSGNPISLTITNPNSLPGTTLSWTQFAISVVGAADGTGSTINQTLTSTSNYPGTVTYTAIANLNGCTSTAVSQVTVKPVPTITSSNQSICSGQTTAITISNTNAITGTTIAWTATPTNVSGSSAGTGFSIAQLLTATTGSPGTVNYGVTATASGCSSPVLPVVATVTPVPQATITANQTICSGPVSLVIGNSNGVLGASYSWTQSTNQVSGASNGSGAAINQTLTATGNLNGLAVYTGTASLNGCSTTAQSTVTVKPVPTVAASNQAICSGQTSSIAISNPNMIGGTTFAWTATPSNVTGSSGGTGTSIAQSLTASVVGTVNYSITATANGCSSPPLVVTETVSPTPVAVSNGSLSMKYGSPITLSTGTFNTYQWTNNSSNIPGATAQNLQILSIGTYRVATTAYASGPVCTSNSLSVILASQSSPVNYVSTIRIMKEGVTPTTSLFTLNQQDLAQSTDYIDGIGRTFQKVAVGLSPTQTDIITPIGYGHQGLVDSTFLPYVRNSKDGRFRRYAIRDSITFGYTNSEQRQFYQNAANVVHDGYPFARTIHRAALDARVTEQGAPGLEWQPGAHSVKSLVTLNKAAYPVKYWMADGTTTGNYPAGHVSVSITTDENGNLVRTYTNKLGQTVLKQVQLDENISGSMVNWLETYYIYDNYGRMIYQLPPKAVSTLGVGPSLNAANPSVAELIYQYTYDGLGRIVEKKTPGAAPEYIIYDNLGRVALTQDGNLRASNQWQFIKYDFLNRPLYSGLYVDASNLTRSSMQAAFVARNYAVEPYYETEAPNAAYQGYTNTVFPTTGLTVLTVNYYDHYDFDRNGSADYIYDYSHLAGIPASANMSIRDMPTGSKKLIMGSANWLVSVVFYDKFRRAIQTQSNNHRNLTVADKSSILYADLAGHISKTKVTHSGGTLVSTTQRYTYDPNWRTLGIYHTIDTNPEQQLVAYTYNLLGQVIDKKLHVSGVTNLQSIDYRYTIRGWLSSINNAKLNNDSGVTNDDTNDYFGIELVYQTTDGGLANTPLYNGNITAAKWKSLGEPTANGGQRSYKFTYDKTDRLKASTFQATDLTGTWNTEANTLNEAMSYDHNGNILTLTRNSNLRGLTGSVVTSAVQTIDNLAYTYATGNQLSKVEDAGTTAGFNNAANIATEYSYTAYGSLTMDKNKGIDSIKYNELNKVKRVKFTDGRVVTYLYDASGAKLTVKNYNTSGVLTTTTDYVGSYVYTNNVLSFFSSPEGRVVKNASSYEYQYAITDHQGNTRILFTSAAQAPIPTIATFEGDANDQSSQYTNVNGTNVVPFVGANHTAGGSKVIRMNQTYAVGPSKSIKVYPGDKIDMETWAYYEANSGYGTSNNPSLITLVASAFGGVSGGGGESGNIFNGVNTALSQFLLGGNAGDTAPAAYLNYILFDANYKPLNMGFTRVPTSAFFAKQLMTIPQVTVKEAGYIFVYLSYEDQSNNFVYFDDLKVTQTKSSLIQGNEYYPFGLQTANSWTRENVTGNNFLANGATELNTTSVLYDLEFRSYDPVLGRMHQVDPKTDKYSSLTPYNYAFNAPSMHTDVNGADPDYVTRRGINNPGRPCDYCGGNFNWLYRGGSITGFLEDSPGQPFNKNSLSQQANAHIDALIEADIQEDLLIKEVKERLGIDISQSNYKYSREEIVTYSMMPNLMDENNPDGTVYEIIYKPQTQWMKSVTKVKEGDFSGWYFTEAFMNPRLAYAPYSNLDVNFNNASSGYGVVAEIGVINSNYQLGLETSKYTESWLNSARGLKAWKILGPTVSVGLGAAGMIKDLSNGKATWGDSASLAVNTAMAFTGPVGLLYLAVDIYVGVKTGYSISDRIKAGVNYSVDHPDY